jgi:hypothetical protein
MEQRKDAGKWIRGCGDKIYKEIMEKERKVWQDKNMYNIKILLKKNDAQEQVWIGKMRLAEVKKVRKEVDPVKSRK